MNRSRVEGVWSNHIDILMTSIVQPTLRWLPGFYCSQTQRSRAQLRLDRRDCPPTFTIASPSSGEGEAMVKAGGNQRVFFRYWQFDSGNDIFTARSSIDERSIEKDAEATAPLWALGKPGDSLTGGRRPRTEPQRIPGADPSGRARCACRSPIPKAIQIGPVSRAEIPGGFRLVVQSIDPAQAGVRPGKLPVSSRWPGRALARRAEAWERVIWSKRSGIKPSRPGTRCFTARSSTWFATSYTTRCWARKTRC